MKNRFNLGTFEYGAKAKWSTLFAVLCFIVILMFPSLALAVSVSGTNFAFTSPPRRSPHSNRISQTAALRRHCAGGRVCDRCRVAHIVCARNTHATTQMRAQVRGLRGTTVQFVHADSRGVTLSAGRSGSSTALRGCDANWGPGLPGALAKDLGNPHRWLVEIFPADARLRTSGNARLVRWQ